MCSNFLGMKNTLAKKITTDIFFVYCRIFLFIIYKFFQNISLDYVDN